MVKKTKKTILVTGAGDFIGNQAALTALESKKYQRVIGADLPGRDLSVLESKGATIRNINPSVKDNCKKIVDGADIVIHAGSIFDLSLSRRELMDANFRSTKNLVEAAAEEGVSHLVFCSSVEVYGSPERTPITESFRLSPENDFGFSMVRAEQACRRISAEMDMPITMVRPSMIYGPDGVHIPSIFCVLPYMINNYVGFAVKLVGGPMLNAVHVDDVVGAMLYLANNPKAYGKAFNVSDSDWLSLGEFIEKMWDPTGIKWKLKLPIMKLPLKLASYFGNIMIPDFAFDFFNSILAGQWDKVVREKGIEPALSPRFDRDMFNYTLNDRVYDNSQLINLGYKLKFPKFDQGYEQTINSFKKKNWIPQNLK